MPAPLPANVIFLHNARERARQRGRRLQFRNKLTDEQRLEFEARVLREDYKWTDDKVAIAEAQEAECLAARASSSRGAASAGATSGPATRRDQFAVQERGPVDPAKAKGKRIPSRPPSPSPAAKVARLGDAIEREAAGTQPLVMRHYTHHVPNPPPLARIPEPTPLGLSPAPLNGHSNHGAAPTPSQHIAPAPATNAKEPVEPAQSPE